MLKGFCRWFWGWEFYTFNISPVRNEAIGPLAGIEPATPANHTDNPSYNEKQRDGILESTSFPGREMGRGMLWERGCTGIRKEINKENN